MARTAGKKQAPPAKVEEDDDAEGWEDAVVEADGNEGQADMRLRDWRDVERFREMKDLRSLVDDDYGLEEIFHVPLKPRPDAAARASRLALPAKLAPKAVPPKPDPKAAAKAHAAAKHAPAKHAPAKHAPAHKAAPKAKAKAKAKPKAKKR